MKVKEQVLALLCAQQGSFLSGQELADGLQVTRAAVWKAVKALQAEGCRIEAVPNRGYALAAGSAAPFCAEAILPLLRGPAQALRPAVHRSLPSTNRAVRTLALAGESEGAVILAGEQTEGCGRAGRSFYSPPGTGLYLSVLLRPALPAEQATLLTTAAALAAARAAEALCGREIGIKWVNDLWLDGRKTAGILTEGALSLESGGLDYAVLGAGFNLEPPAAGFPAALRDTAGVLCPAGAPPGARARLAAGFLNEFWPLYRALPDRAFLQEYRRRLFFLGREVTVLRGAEQWRAVALDLDEDGRLLLRRADGTTERLSGGEIRITGV